jgi:hypothetical protein
MIASIFEARQYKTVKAKDKPRVLYFRLLTLGDELEAISVSINLSLQFPF